MIIRRTVFTTLLMSALILIANNVLSADYINDAKHYLEKGDFDAAMIQLKNQLKQNPADAQARYLLGTIYLEKENIKGAEKELQKAYELDKQNEKIQLEYANVLLIKKEYQEVKTFLAQAFTDIENESKRLTTIGYAFLGEQKIADAKDFFTQAEKIKITPSVQLGFAKIALLEKDFKASETIIAAILKQEPENYEALIFKAVLAREQNRFKEALSIYDHLLTKKPGNLVLFFNRAQTKYNFKDYEGAEKDAARVLKNNDNIPQANYLMALIKYAQENFSVSEQYAQKVLNVIPQHYQSMYIAGKADIRLGRLNQAEKYFTQILSQYPDNLEVQYTLARIYLSQNEAEQALLILQAIDQDTLDKNPKMLLLLGTAYLILDEKEKSLEIINRAKKLAPKEQLVSEQLARIYLFSGDVTNAIKELEKLDVTKKDNTTFQYQLIMSYMKNKTYAKAKDLILELQKLSPDDPNLIVFHGDIAFIEKNQQLAAESYQKALTIDDTFIPAYLGLSKIALFNKQLEQADNYFQRILSINDQYVNAYIGRAAIAEQLGKTGPAEQILIEGINKVAGDLNKELAGNNALANLYIKHDQKAKLLKLGRELIKKYPEKTQALSFQAKTLLINGENRQAASILSKIIYLEPKDIKHRTLLAQLLIQDYEQQAAIKLLDEILEIKPGHKQTVYLKSNLLLYYGQFEALTGFLKQFLEADKTNFNLAYQLAVQAQKQGKYKLAVEYYKILMEFQPENIVILNNLAWLYSVQGNPKALSLAKKAYQLKPQSPAIADTYGTILLKQGKVKQGLKILQKAAATSPEIKDLQFHLAQAYHLNNINNKAIKILEAITKSDDAFREKGNAIALLQKIK